MEKYRAGQAFNLIRDKVTLPDVTINLDQHQWQVHSDLLTAESGFFRAALQDGFTEATTKQIAMHDDDVWTLARFIQYLYESSYETVRERGYGPCCSAPNVRLRDIVGKRLQSGTVADADMKQSHQPVHAHCMIILFADKYDVPNLLEYAARQLSREVGWALRDGKDQFWLCFGEVGADRIRRHEVLQDVFASMVVNLFPDLDDDRLQRLCQDDPGLTHKINRHLRQEVVRWKAEAMRIDALLPKTKRKWTAS